MRCQYSPCWPSCALVPPFPFSAWLIKDHGVPGTLLRLVILPAFLEISLCRPEGDASSCKCKQSNLLRVCVWVRSCYVTQACLVLMILLPQGQECKECTTTSDYKLYYSLFSTLCILNIMYTWARVAEVCAFQCRCPQRHQIPLELELQTAVNGPVWVLEANPGSLQE